MFKEVNLEVSMKAFMKNGNTSENILNIVHQIFNQWQPLLKNREQISILLWLGDGSDILDYTGNLDNKIEWAYFVGCANKPSMPFGEKLDANLHELNSIFMENPPVVTYCTIKYIVDTIKAEGEKLFPASKILVGLPFDIGPEFARSDFKYRRHPEICTGSGEGTHTFINSYGNLNGDNYPYAGFPQGIEDGTPFGTFLGRQTQVYFDDMGFDYLWLSNGVGFSANSWHPVGDIFDGQNFHTEKIKEVEDLVFSFWKNFRKECPNYPVYTRGTNFSAGIDYAVDAVGLHKIYNANLNILPPPNSPWAAINNNYGLELMGHMTRICELPSDQFMFRFYLHDPWWMNSPWYDRYGSNPHDIYMPMALSRIDKDGNTRSAEIFNILTIDNTMGEMPDHCAYETLPHFLKAEKDAPDAPSPFVWAYPFKEYTSAKTEEDLIKILTGDLFICRAITSGFPLSSIVSCDNFINHNKELYSQSIIVTPVPEKGTLFEKTIFEYIENNGKVLFYGSADNTSSKFMDMFKLSIKDGICGEISINPDLHPDTNRDGIKADKIYIRKDTCNGKLNTISDGILADNYSLSAKYKNAVWYRAPLSLQSLNYDTEELKYIDNPAKYIWGEALLRSVIKDFGYDISFSKATATNKTPIIMLSKSDNGIFCSFFSPDTSTETYLDFPLGAPLFIGYETELKNSKAVYHFPKSGHLECRVFVKQTDGVVSVREVSPVSVKYRRRIEVKGLENATVRFMGEEYCKENISVRLNPCHDYMESLESISYQVVNSKENGTYIEVKNVTGKLVFSIPYK